MVFGTCIVGSKLAFQRNPCCETDLLGFMVRARRFNAALLLVLRGIKIGVRHLRRKCHMALLFYVVRSPMLGAIGPQDQVPSMPAKTRLPRKRIRSRDPSGSRRILPKAPTGIPGLDEISAGGLPRGRTSLVCGSAGCGKTLLAMEFLVRGAREFDEPGVFMSFEESASELAQNVASMGFDVERLVARKQLLIDHVRVVRGEMSEAGSFDLEGLFIRLGLAIDTSERSGSCWTRSKRSSEGSRTREFFARNCDDSSNGSRIAASPPSSRRARRWRTHSAWA